MPIKRGPAFFLPPEGILPPEIEERKKEHAKAHDVEETWSRKYRMEKEALEKIKKEKPKVEPKEERKVKTEYD